MKLNRGLAVLVVVASVAVVPAPAAAQVHVGQNIQMTTMEGLVAKGRVMSISPGEMDFRDADGNVMKVAFGGVRKIQVVDSKANGFIGGALAGGAAVAAFHFGSYFIGFAPTAQLTAVYGYDLKKGVIGGAIIGGLIGMSIDSGKMKTIYARGDDDLTVKLHPIVSAAGKGVGAQVRW